MSEHPLNDPLLEQLRNARPMSTTDWSPTSPSAQAMYQSVTSSANGDLVPMTPMRGHRRTRQGVLVGVAAALVGMLVVGGTVLSSSSPGTKRPATAIQVKLLAYRSKVAFAHAVSDGIEEVQTTYTPSDGLVSDTTTVWHSDDTQRMQVSSSDGSPMFDLSVTNAENQLTASAVDYSNSTWSTVTTPSASATSSSGTTNPFVDATDIASSLQQGVTSGAYQVVSADAVINGVSTIEISRSITVENGTSSDGVYIQTYWVDPTTYLPLQRLDTLPQGTALSTFTWMDATPDNVALLNATIPSGFTQTNQPVSFAFVGFGLPTDFGAPGVSTGSFSW